MASAYPRTTPRFTSGTKLDALGGVLSFSSGVVFDVVDDHSDQTVSVEARVTVGSVDTFLHYARKIAELNAVE